MDEFYNGDLSALERLFEIHGPTLARLVYHYLMAGQRPPGPDTAEVAKLLVEESVFAEVVVSRRPGQLRYDPGAEPVDWWLCGIARRVVGSYLAGRLRLTPNS